MEKEKNEKVEHNEETKDKAKVKDVKVIIKQNKELQEEVEKLTKELQDTTEKMKSIYEGAARYNDTARYYKNEYDRLVKYRSQSLAEKLIPVLDNFQFAFKTKATTKEMENYQTGFQYVAKMMLDALSNEGITSIVPKVNDKFDPKLHHAIESIETEDENLFDNIAEVQLNGYLLLDRLLRPANVVVYTKKVEKPQEKVNEEAIEA